MNENGAAVIMPPAGALAVAPKENEGVAEVDALPLPLALALAPRVGADGAVVPVAAVNEKVVGIELMPVMPVVPVVPEVPVL